jgi:hypothetical protein
VTARRRKTLAAIGCAASLAGSACTVVGPSYEDPTPEARLNAIRETAANGRMQDIPHLIQNLAADDAAVRFAAISELRRLTGTTNGYDFEAGEPERIAAIEQWKKWLAAHPVPQ